MLPLRLARTVVRRNELESLAANLRGVTVWNCGRIEQKSKFSCVRKGNINAGNTSSLAAYCNNGIVNILSRSSVHSVRSFTQSTIQCKKHAKETKEEMETVDKLIYRTLHDPAMQKLEDIKSPEDLFGPGAKPGTVPTDLEQATGLERLELLGKYQGKEVFDMNPLDSSRVGTMDNPIIVESRGEERYAGCTGCPADSHMVKWLTLSRDRPIERCPECGSVYKMNYTGPDIDAHDHHHSYQEPKTMADFIKPEYRYR